NRAVLGFAGGYHGMTYRAASVSDSMAGRETVAHIGDFVALPFVKKMTNDDLDLLDRTLRAGVDGQKIGAILLEATQGEGGARAFDPAYLAALRTKATELGIMVIADEVQAGVGRTGAFFSFEGSGLDPDIVCLSKAISGLGLPMAINLIRRNLDTWNAGEFTGTFRGNNLAFATSTKMLQTYWSDNLFEQDTKYKGIFVRDTLQAIADTYESLHFTVNGNGLLCGLDVKNTELADRVTRAAFDRQLIVETCGAGDQVVKLLPPLTTTDEELRIGLEPNQDIMNQLHNHFEHLQGTVWGLSDWYKEADYDTKFAIRQLNNLCHEAESLMLSQRKQAQDPQWIRPSQITTFLNAERLDFPEA
ncbi:MAG: aminotransferase class III-fold pyridoxal phosphate-dependent enzyme, partial [Actinobacteria bacterium]|nr:aminotransferase class III-fold pyridoxal phosphate-dependent enzyme [Actinomycetota bacterium]